MTIPESRKIRWLCNILHIIDEFQLYVARANGKRVVGILARSRRGGRKLIMRGGFGQTGNARHGEII